MKETIKYLCALFALVPIFLFISCSNLKEDDGNNLNDKNIKFAIIETSTFNNVSYLNEYTYDGKKKFENKIKCADINSGWITPLSTKNSVYLNSVGGYSNRSNVVVEFDILNNKNYTHEIDYGIISLTANDDYIFTSSSPPKGSVITKYSKKSSSIENKLEVSGFVSHLNFINGLIYAFIDSDNKDGKMTISVINPDTLKIQKSFNLVSDTNVMDSLKVNNDIFYTHFLKSDSQNKSNILSKFNLADGSVTNIPLKEINLKQLKIYNDNLIILHYDFQNQIGNKLTVMNLKSNAQKIITFNHNLNQIEVKDNKLYTCDKNYMYIYELDNFKLLNKFEIGSHKKDYRIQGFFIVN